MANEIISYLDMCQRETSSLQRGMNFDLARGYSVILMSIRTDAPYRDRFEDDSVTLIYEGHDMPKSQTVPDPKAIGQPERTAKGTLTENGKFFAAAMAYREGTSSARRVRVYEKIRQGIWSYNGVFQLVDAWQEPDGKRTVFKFPLVAQETDDIVQSLPEPGRRRLIPTRVKVEVWNRDKGRCVICGATDELHFDHDLPFSKGGTSVAADNVQLLCVRHNLSKGSKIT